MLIGVNELNQIKQIREITDPKLTVIDVDDTSELYPFRNWSDTKILCYCFDVVSLYPYVDTNKIVDFENEILNLQAQVIDLEFEKILGGMPI